VPIVADNQQQFVRLETKLVFEYRNNVLSSFKIDLVELEKIFDPYKLSDSEFEYFTPSFKNMPSS
jgi:hypothetical protein